ncbi:hypothetical protein CHUAL_012696 [Chamberlinius hualienensis]
MYSLAISGVNDFLTLINETTGMSEILVNQGPLTVFAPIDQQTNSNTTDVSPNWAYHVVRGRISDKDFKNDLQLGTLVTNKIIRINKFYSGLLTVNCVPLVQLNREASNGMVHTIQLPLYEQTQESISEVISRDPQLSILSSALSKAKLNALLRDSAGPFTLFAPTNGAFQAMDRHDYEAIFSQPETLNTLLRHHMLSETWCSRAVVSKANFWTTEKSLIKVTCNSTGTYVNNGGIIKKDLMATNGVIHIIDKVLIHRKVRSLYQIVHDLKLRQLHLLVSSSAQLKDVFVNGAKFTLFAPTDQAISLASKHNISAYDFVMGHMVTGKHLSVDFIDQMPLISLVKDMRPLQIKLYPQNILVDGAALISKNYEGRNGVVHVIDRVIQRPTETIGEFIIQQNFSILINALNKTTSRLLEQLSEDQGPFTLFAPDDDAFGTLPYFTLDRMLLDEIILTNIMENHVLDEEVWTGGLLPKAYYNFQCRNGQVVKIREDTGVVTAAIAIVTKADIRCTNGVVHLIDRVIQFG